MDFDKCYPPRDMSLPGREPEVVVYPGAPLRAVAIEVGFSDLIDAVSRFGAFHRRHAADFDRIYETSADGEEMPADGREFNRPRSTVLMGRGPTPERAVSIAKDQLAVITYPYDRGYSGFLSWALPTLREGLADLDVTLIKSVAYRYENRIRHDTTKLDLSSLLRISLASPVEAGDSIRHVHLYWHQRWPEGPVQVEVDACPNVSEDFVHLNITAHRRTKTGALDELESLVRDAHRRARLTFESLVTAQLRERIQVAPH